MGEGDIQSANQALTDSIIDLPGVTAVGIGECDGAPCLKVLVVEKTDELVEAIPNLVDGFPVIVEESGPIEALEVDEADGL